MSYPLAWFLGLTHHYLELFFYNIFWLNASFWRYRDDQFLTSGNCWSWMIQNWSIQMGGTVKYNILNFYLILPLYHLIRTSICTYHQNILSSCTKTCKINIYKHPILFSCALCGLWKWWDFGCKSHVSVMLITHSKILNIIISKVIIICCSKVYFVYR